MTLTKHDAVKQYFEPKVAELAGDILGFNFSPESSDSIALITNYSDQVVKKYITGKVKKQYGFTIIVVKSYSTSGDDLNLEAMNFVQAFMEWLEKQDSEKIYPDFGKNCSVEKLECLQNMPNLAGVNAQAGLARYMVQCRILYMERKEK